MSPATFGSDWVSLERTLRRRLPSTQKLGYAWMPKGTQVEVMTPGANAKHNPAGALDLGTGTLHHCLGPRKTNGLFRDLLRTLEETYPTTQYQRIYVVVDNYKIYL
jgi:hypothetical protein